MRVGILVCCVAALSLTACTCGGPGTCATSSECAAPKPVCDQAKHECVACLADTDCPDGSVCNADGVCEAGCRSDQDRCALGTFCKPGLGCVDCVTDAQCQPGNVCGGNNTCIPGCSAANPNCPLGQVCDQIVGRCVSCVTSLDCHNPQIPVCNTTTHSCVQCVANTDCHDPSKPVCDPASNSCVRCVGDADCPAGNLCRANACVPGCSATHPCPTGQQCDPQTSQCVACLSDTDCSGATPRCNLAAHACVPCLPGATDNCPTGEYCRADFVCERGCKTGANCVSGTCGIDHNCTGCTSDTECAAGHVCNGGTCVAACDAQNPCGTGQDCCGGHCKDLQNDVTNCGTCGNSCGTGSACCNGSCSSLDSTASCGACGTACGTGQGCCGRSCTSLNSLTHCGACGTACGVDQFCDSVQCRNVVFPEFCANKNVYAIRDGITLDGAATDVLASTIVQYCSTQTTVQYGPQTNASWVDQTNGALLLGGGSTVVTAGGPVPNKPVKWLETTRQATKVYFASNNIDTFYFRKRSDGSNIVSRAASLCSSHYDVFLVEVVADPTSGTLALIAYGLCSGGYGTQTGAWYWANTMLPNRANYPDSWYLYEWVDTDNNSLPGAGDTFTRLASGQ